MMETFLPLKAEIHAFPQQIAYSKEINFSTIKPVKIYYL